MTTGHKIPLQLWVRHTDVNGMLMEIGGWHVGSHAAVEAREGVQYAIEAGWVQTRLHYFPDGTTSPAYELTDLGLRQLEDSYGPKARASAEYSRDWYRKRVAAATAQPTPAVME